MKRLKTLRAHFALWTAGLLFVILSAFGVLIFESMARGLSVALDDSLTLVASQFIAGLEIENGSLVSSENIALEPENIDLRARGFTVRVLTLQGTILYEFGSYQNLLSSPEGAPSTPFFTTLHDPLSEYAIRVYTVPVEGNDQPVAIVQIAQSLASVQDILQRLLITLLVSIPTLVAIAGLSGYFLAIRALTPIDRITRTARRISAEDLSARLNLPPIDDEVGRLAETFDAMLGRLDDSFRRERQFTSDASHELRTPLSAMQAILSMIRQKRRTPEEYELALADLAEETDRLRTLTENLLQLARGETHTLTAHDPVDLSTLLRDVTSSLQSLAEAKALTMVCDIPDGLSLIGDSDDLIRLFVNLLDNAIKYTERGGVTISADQNKDSSITVTIADTGIGIPADSLPYIFNRFYRVDQARATSGAGLGLALASEIARAHGGKIEVASEVGKGTRLTVILPKDFQFKDKSNPKR